MAVAALVALAAATAVVVDNPASATPPAANVYTSGHARFEVLSPTLIRTEYSGDDNFTDDPTFNAIGRGNFTPTTSTSATADGWLVITTPKATLKYKVDSGSFTDKNLVLTEQSGAQNVTASPWSGQVAPACTIGTLCEAEGALLSGLGTGTDHTGYTGSGFAAGFEALGSSMSVEVDVTNPGSYDLDLRYANNKDGTTRTLGVAVDGTAAGQINLPVTNSWDTWQVAPKTLDLSAGKHTITVSHGPSDSADVNVDSLAVVTSGSDYPAASTTVPATCAFGTVCEAESGTLGGNAATATNHNDYSGTSFVAVPSANSSDTLHLTGVPADGTYALQLRYSSGTGAARPVSIAVGSNATTSTTLPGTSNWDSWRIVTTPVALKAGTNDVSVQCPNADACGVNIDTLAVGAANGPLLAPHAPLGGYRRGLDGVDGAATTLPGLLYQDGWYLLDDTASSIFDSATKSLTPRPTHAGLPYQDGYVFAYGQDYDQALSDLATLTGPSELLPRWAYGVWYSEYYNHSAADYENTILPKFRSDGVPLDAMVTDTDFKAPDRWDGWEMDKTQFPDPAAYFAWAHANGLHTSLNIHPSVLDTDPQYAAAQSTANNTLTQNNNGCYSDISHGAANCYIFDWSDPNQLKAYFDLHDQIKGEGNDVWWLDWCCDQSVSSSAGVTPDAWINQNYAWYTDDTLGRGFNLSRAYGSLQAGGQQALPTGPWADKRTTAHFTGDTTSSWGTLAMEVGYTPGESASTGLSAVSHDIGGFNDASGDGPGAEQGSKKLPDDLYARWVQLGAFQPILRLHGNHSDRLPWQYGDAAKSSAESFLNLRENLVPYTYSLAQQAATTGVPVTRPLYLQYPASQDAYANAGAEYLYGPDVLVAPVTKAGAGSVDTQVWFPPGNSWTDYFTGKTYQGGTTQNVSTTLATMPVFVKSGGIVTTRTDNVTNDDQNPLTKVTVDVAAGANGSYSMYEDNGTTTDATQSATTPISYTEKNGVDSLHIAPAEGTFAGQVTNRAWTARFTNTAQPNAVSVDGTTLSAGKWAYAAKTRTLTVSLPARAVSADTTVSFTLNKAPTAAAISKRTAVGVAVAIGLRGSDPNHDRLTYSHTSPKHGKVTGTGASLKYTSARTFTGVDHFTYTVSDPFGAKVTRNVTVTVTRQAPKVAITVSPRRITAKTAAVLAVRVRLAGGVSAGHAVVSARSNGRLLRSGRLSGNAVRLTLPKLGKGKHTITVTVAGSTLTTPVTTRVQLRVS